MMRKPRSLLLPLLCATAAHAAPPPQRPPQGVVRHGTFFSPMGEPFRATEGGRSPDQVWFDRADLNHDGRLTLEEMRLDAQRFFKTLDVNKDGEIDPDEITRYETDIAPETSVAAESRFGSAEYDDRGNGAYDDIAADITQGNLRTHHNRVVNGRRGAGAYSYLDLPEPVISADRDFNRGVSAREFDQAAQQRFRLLDQAHAGYLTKESLAALR